MSRRLNILFTSAMRTWWPVVWARPSSKSSSASHFSLSACRYTMDNSFSDDHTSFDELEPKSFSPEEYFDCHPILRRKSTVEDEQRLILLLKNILSYQDKHVSSWIVEVRTTFLAKLPCMTIVLGSFKAVPILVRVRIFI